MSAEENKQIIRRFINDFINTGIVDGIEDIVSPDYTEVFDGKRYPAGIEGAKAHILGVRKTYEGLTLTIERQIAEGEWVATCYTARGKHTGEFGRSQDGAGADATGMSAASVIKPTGKDVAFTAVNIDRVVDGKVVEHGGAANMMETLLAVGAIKIS